MQVPEEGVQRPEWSKDPGPCPSSFSKALRTGVHRSWIVGIYNWCLFIDLNVQQPTTPQNIVRGLTQISRHPRCHEPWSNSREDRAFSSKPYSILCVALGGITNHAGHSRSKREKGVLQHLLAPASVLEDSYPNYIIVDWLIIICLWKVILQGLRDV